MHSDLRSLDIIGRCAFSGTAVVVGLLVALDCVRSGQVELQNGLVIRRTERPGRFWFFVATTTGFSLLGGAVLTYILWNLVVAG